MICASTCGDVVLEAMPPSCILSERYTTPSRLLFMSCSVMLPDPIKGAIKPLFDAGDIVASSPLANWEFTEPNMVDRVLSACEPARQIVTYRQISVQDRFSITSSSGSPAVTNGYAEYAFYRDKLQNAQDLYVLLMHCNGDVFIPKLNHTKNLVKASISGYTTYERIDEVSGLTVEFKQFRLRFQGDPFSFNEPDFNIFDEGIIL